jgi:hypothetical protein
MGSKKALHYSHLNRLFPKALNQNMRQIITCACVQLLKYDLHDPIHSILYIRDSPELQAASSLNAVPACDRIYPGKLKCALRAHYKSYSRQGDECKPLLLRSSTEGGALHHQVLSGIIQKAEKLIAKFSTRRSIPIFRSAFQVDIVMIDCCKSSNDFLIRVLCAF